MLWLISQTMILHVNGDRHAKAMYVKSSKTSQVGKTKKVPAHMLYSQ